MLWFAQGPTSNGRRFRQHDRPRNQEPQRPGCGGAANARSRHRTNSAAGRPLICGSDVLRTYLDRKRSRHSPASAFGAPVNSGAVRLTLQVYSWPLHVLKCPHAARVLPSKTVSARSASATAVRSALSNDVAKISKLAVPCGDSISSLYIISCQDRSRIRLRSFRSGCDISFKPYQGQANAPAADGRGWMARTAGVGASVASVSDGGSRTGRGGWEGKRHYSATRLPGSNVGQKATGTWVYGLTCNGGGGNASLSATLTVTNPGSAPTIRALLAV